MSTLPARLQELQKANQVLKKDVADAIGVSQMSYYRYEKGDRQLTEKQLVALADYFDVSLDYLVGRSDDPTRH